MSAMRLFRTVFSRSNWRKYRLPSKKLIENANRIFGKVLKTIYGSNNNLTQDIKHW
jgi:hypothetical protein